MPKSSSKNTSTVKAFFNAIKENNLTQLKKILSNAPQLLNTLNENHLNALHVAIMHNHITIVVFLVNEQNMDVNGIGPNNVTPLHLAVRKNNYLLVHFLIEKNATINCVDNADITQRDKNGVTPMTGLPYNDTLKIIKIWLPKRIETILREHFTLPSGELTTKAKQWIAKQQAIQAPYNPIVIDLTTDESSAEYPITSYANFFPAHTSYLTGATYNFSPLRNATLLNFSPSPQ